MGLQDFGWGRSWTARAFGGPSSGLPRVLFFERFEVQVGYHFCLLDQHIVRARAAEDFGHDRDEVEYEQSAKDDEKLKESGDPFVSLFSNLGGAGVRSGEENDFIEADGFLHGIEHALDLGFVAGDGRKKAVVMQAEGPAVIIGMAGDFAGQALEIFLSNTFFFNGFLNESGSSGGEGIE